MARLPSTEALVRWFTFHYLNERSTHLSERMMARVRLFRNDSLEAAAVMADEMCETDQCSDEVAERIRKLKEEL